MPTHLPASVWRCAEVLREAEEGQIAAKAEAAKAEHYETLEDTIRAEDTGESVAVRVEKARHYSFFGRAMSSAALRVPAGCSNGPFSITD